MKQPKKVKYIVFLQTYFLTSVECSVNVACTNVADGFDGAGNVGGVDGGSEKGKSINFHYLKQR